MNHLLNIFGELAVLYGQLEQMDKQSEYRQKYKDNGGIDQ